MHIKHSKFPYNLKANVFAYVQSVKCIICIHPSLVSAEQMFGETKALTVHYIYFSCCFAERWFIMCFLLFSHERTEHQRSTPHSHSASPIFSLTVNQTPEKKKPFPPKKTRRKKKNRGRARYKKEKKS